MLSLFPGSLMVRILCFLFCGLCSIPGWGTEILQATRHSQVYKEKKRSLWFLLLFLSSLLTVLDTSNLLPVWKHFSDPGSHIHMHTHDDNKYVLLGEHPQIQGSPSPVEVMHKSKEIITTILCHIEGRHIKILKEEKFFSIEDCKILPPSLSLFLSHCLLFPLLLSF